MLCECGCLIAMTPFKGGESILDMMDFAQRSLQVYEKNIFKSNTIFFRN